MMVYGEQSVMTFGTLQMQMLVNKIAKMSQNYYSIFNRLFALKWAVGQQ